jgi:hypothetical protein
MPTCDTCGATILFGGQRDAGGRAYCGQNCYEKRRRLPADVIPLGFAEEKARLVYEGDCPRCGGRGPVELHAAHVIYSFAVVSHQDEKQIICCQACGTRERLKAILMCGVCGWWSMHGLIMTPIQIARNLHGLMSNGETSKPSSTLVSKVREELTRQLEEEDRLGAGEG